MPTLATFHPHDLDPRKWDRCMRQAATAMIAAGWQPYARKFSAVRLRKATKLFWQ